MNESMRVDAKPGARIVYKNINAGYESDRFLANAFLKENEIYTIEGIDVSSWSTCVRLKEIAGDVWFNSVLFIDEKSEPMSEPKKFDTAYRNEIICPHCDSIVSGSWDLFEYDDFEEDVRCQACLKLFDVWQSSVTVYSTYKKKESEGGK